MRTYVIQGLAAAAALVLAACSNRYPQQPTDPINKDPRPQTAINDPQPQPRGPGFDMDDQAQRPINDPTAQQPSFGQPSSPGAVTSPESQRPFYGPGLVSPEERERAMEKSKTAPLGSDAEVLAFVMAMNDSEVQMAEMAKKKADNAEVKSYAAMMLQQHTQGMAKVRTLQTKTKLELKDNELTTNMKNDAGQNMSMLRDKEDKDFDRLYIDSQVRMHKDALDVLDNRVIPAISNGEVKSTVSEMRRQVAHHLAKAEQIQRKIDPTDTKANGPR
jgi:putative membrane protein